ncbi:hypothetical protein L204_105950 [Cryptococcus depauperatus]|nr:hypothetical protein L204_05072 [Cryptococcus depauperatus CBS 7855]
MLRRFRRTLAQQQRKPLPEDFDLCPSESEFIRSISPPFSVFAEPSLTPLSSPNDQSSQYNATRDEWDNSMEEAGDLQTLKRLYDADDPEGEFRREVKEMVRRQIASQWRMFHRSELDRSRFQQSESWNRQQDESQDNQRLAQLGAMASTRAANSNFNSTLYGTLPSEIRETWEAGSPSPRSFVYPLPVASSYEYERETLPAYESCQGSTGLPPPTAEDVTGQDFDNYGPVPSYHTIHPEENTLSYLQEYLHANLPPSHLIMPSRSITRDVEDLHPDQINNRYATIIQPSQTSENILMRNTEVDHDMIEASISRYRPPTPWDFNPVGGALPQYDTVSDNEEQLQRRQSSSSLSSLSQTSITASSFDSKSSSAIMSENCYPYTLSPPLSCGSFQWPETPTSMSREYKLESSIATSPLSQSSSESLSSVLVRKMLARFANSRNEVESDERDKSGRLYEEGMGVAWILDDSELVFDEE